MRLRDAFLFFINMILTSNNVSFESISGQAGGVRPRMVCPMIATRKSTIKIKNSIFAISTETAATPPNPRKPAIKAMIRNVTAHCNMRSSCGCCTKNQ